MSRIARLDKLSNSFPDANSSVEKKQQAALNMQMSAQAPTTKAATQALAGKGAEMSSSISLQNQQPAQQNLLQSGQAQIAATGQAGEQQLQRLQLAQNTTNQEANLQASADTQQAGINAKKQVTNAEIEQQQRLQTMGITQDNRLLTLDLEQRQAINNLGGDIKEELFDNQLRFKQDEIGRAFTNERQLADYAISNAKDNIHLTNRLQEMSQASQKELIMLEASHNTLVQALKQGYDDNKQKLDQASKTRIQSMITEMNKELERKRRKAGATAMIFQGAVGGASTGAAVGGPYGAIIGGVVGAGAGYMASEQQ